MASDVKIESPTAIDLEKNKTAIDFDQAKRVRFNQKIEQRKKLMKNVEWHSKNKFHPRSHMRKRSWSFTTGEHKNNNKRFKRFHLPTNFLLGGNIADPLNLNDIAENHRKGIPMSTPTTSPFETPKNTNEVIEVIIPPNIRDPLNLNAERDDKDFEKLLISPRRRKRHRSKRGKQLAIDTNDKTGECSTAVSKLNFDVPVTPAHAGDTRRNTCKDEEVRVKKKEHIDKNKIVSPVVPQAIPRCTTRRLSGSEKSNHKPRKRSRSRSGTQSGDQEKKKVNFRKKDEKFQYGNYDRYYGYRNPQMRGSRDYRLDYLQKEWFEGKDVLDIGCNVGDMTLSVARDFKPKKITGLDIDPKLIKMAKKNIRYFAKSEEEKQFPKMMCQIYGPMGTAFLHNNPNEFPSNVKFQTVSPFKLYHTLPTSKIFFIYALPLHDSF